MWSNQFFLRCNRFPLGIIYKGCPAFLGKLWPPPPTNIYKIHMGIRFSSLTRTWIASCSTASSFCDKARSTDRCAPRRKKLTSNGMSPDHYRLDSNGYLTLNCPNRWESRFKSVFGHLLVWIAAAGYEHDQKPYSVICWSESPISAKLATVGNEPYIYKNDDIK